MKFHMAKATDIIKGNAWEKIKKKNLQSFLKTLPK